MSVTSGVPYEGRPGEALPVVMVLVLLLPPMVMLGATFCYSSAQAGLQCPRAWHAFASGLIRVASSFPLYPKPPPTCLPPFPRPPQSCTSATTSRP